MAYEIIDTVTGQLPLHTPLEQLGNLGPIACFLRLPSAIRKTGNPSAHLGSLQSLHCPICAFPVRPTCWGPSLRQLVGGRPLVPLCYHTTAILSVGLGSGQELWCDASLLSHRHPPHPYTRLALGALPTSIRTRTVGPRTFGPVAQPRFAHNYVRCPRVSGSNRC